MLRLLVELCLQAVSVLAGNLQQAYTREPAEVLPALVDVCHEYGPACMPHVMAYQCLCGGVSSDPRLQRMPCAPLPPPPIVCHKQLTATLLVTLQKHFIV
mgnify:CR=1 FL=1